MTRTFQATDRRGAKLLEDGRRRRLLLSFVTRERSLKEAAEMNSMPLNLAHYHVQQLLGGGLVEIAREQKRAGRAVRFYRSPYTAFVVPESLLRRRPSERLARNLDAALDHARDLAGAGVVFELDDAGRPRMRQLQGEGPPPLEIWRRLKLDRKQARLLFEEIGSVLRSHESRQGEAGSGWTLHLALGEADI